MNSVLVATDQEPSSAKTVPAAPAARSMAADLDPELDRKRRPVLERDVLAGVDVLEPLTARHGIHVCVPELLGADQHADAILRAESQGEQLRMLVHVVVLRDGTDLYQLAARSWRSASMPRSPGHTRYRSTRRSERSGDTAPLNPPQLARVRARWAGGRRSVHLLPLALSLMERAGRTLGAVVGRSLSEHAAANNRMTEVIDRGQKRGIIAVSSRRLVGRLELHDAGMLPSRCLYGIIKKS